MKTQEKISRAVEDFVEGLAEMLAETLARSIQTQAGGRHRRRAGRLDMTCRVEGCKTRSGGPRNRYFCPEHQKLPKAEQDRYLAAYKAAQH
jgi:hypothetical protein